VRVEELETLRYEEHPNLLHVIVRGEDGAEGLGETFFDAEAVESELHERLAPGVLGARVSGPGTGPVPDEALGPAPTGLLRSPAWSARSALDLALHDLRARAAGLPLCSLLSDAPRESVPVYVTCIDPEHPGETWGLGVPGGSEHRDWTDVLERPAELAVELCEAGFRGAKLFPFERAEGETGGRSIGADALGELVEPFRAMRAAAGPDFELLCDLGGGWQLEPALAIARALEPYELGWLEDPLPPEQLDDLRTIAGATRIPLAGHEARTGHESFRLLIETGAVSVAHLDVQWCGGLSEARRIAALAAERGLPVAFHDCAGPVAWACSVHAALALPNASRVECARPYALDAYPAMVEGVPALADGAVMPAPGPGHGVTLSSALASQARRRVSR
jgi:L-alanine-DL-glutamate epimerase-like enolase superfamily enzyme